MRNNLFKFEVGLNVINCLYHGDPVLELHGVLCRLALGNVTTDMGMAMARAEQQANSS